MKHLEEGTIHAWLDGALSDAEAKEVSQHAASCAQCAALVAEARGFIAGASRILTSLDDVPAVAPKRAPIVASGKPQRFWQASPWVTGIAAALILAVGIKEWIDRPSAKAAFMPVQVTMDSLRAAPIPAATLVDSAVRLQERRSLRPVSSAPARAPVAQPPVVARERLDRNEPAKKDATSGEVASAKLGPVAQGAGGAAVSAPIAQAAPVPAPLAKSSLEDLAERSRDGQLSPSCYRLATDVVRQNFAPSATSNVQARRAASSPAREAAPASVAADASVAPQIVRLDTAGTNRIRVVTSLAGQPLGTWTLDGDTARLILRSLGVRAIPLTNRVACPALDPK